MGVDDHMDNSADATSIQNARGATAPDGLKSDKTDSRPAASAMADCAAYKNNDMPENIPQASNPAPHDPAAHGVSSGQNMGSMPEDGLKAWEEDLRKRGSAQYARERELQSREMELARKLGLAEEKENILEQREQEACKRETALLARENELREKQIALEGRFDQAEADIRKKQLDEQAAFEKALTAERNKAMADLRQDLEDYREKFDISLKEKESLWEESFRKRENEEIEKAQTRVSEILRQAEKDAALRVAFLLKNAEEKDAQAQERLNRIEIKENELHQKEINLQNEEEQLEADRQKHEREDRRQRLRAENLEAREADLDATISEGISDRIEAYEKRLRDKDDSLAEIRERYRRLDAERAAMENFKVSLGESPEQIRHRVEEMQKKIDSLSEEVASRASIEMEKENAELKYQCRQLETERDEIIQQNRFLEEKNRELAQHGRDNVILREENEGLKSNVETLEAQAESYRQRIKRLSAKEETLADYDIRVAAIREGYLPELIGANLPNEHTELEWLGNISDQCAKYGVPFPRRILYAFHTALKISDWSSITVLAGVSGTGKSELPKLYASFGGMNFINVPVQPNWDSQESMLGFFNSIVNRFEPEDLLRFLVQCTEDPVYNKYMSIVLLDEMNLAHVEYYFADFLSKLETRRSDSKDHLPWIGVKLGAGVPPYRLKLVRTIMWTGTMNQDETTKSLSDKVLDRGLVINFPRPKTLRSRPSMPVLENMIKEQNRPMLKKETWNKWIVRKIELKDEQLKEMMRYRGIVERINSELEHVGRALGHRVWQSVEYYMLNYPLVSQFRRALNGGEMSTELKKAMRVAFEDQIVQKIMPKLRGVETKGHSKASLDAIEALLEDEGFESLKDDFKIACEQGYGQFIWSSAKYIEADEEREESTAVKTEAESIQDGNLVTDRQS